MKIINGNIKTIDSESQSLKAIKTEDGRIIEGYFTTKDPDRGGDITLPTAFTKTMKIFKLNPLVTFMHDWKKPIGNMIDYRIDNKGVWVRIKIAEGIQWIDDIWNLVEQKVVRALSYGYRPIEFAKVDVDGKDYKQLKEVELLEIAIVTIPMNATALFTVKAGAVKGIDIRRGGETTEAHEEFKDVETIKFNINKYSPEEAHQFMSAYKVETSIKNFYSDNSDHVFELYKGIKTTKELCVALKDGISLTVTDEKENELDNESKEGADEKGVLQETLDEREKKRASNLCFLWHICYVNLVKVDIESKKDAQKKANVLIDEFASIAKGKSLEFIKYQQEMLQEMEQARGVRSLKEMGVEELSRVLQELNSKIDVLPDSKAGRVLSSINRNLISDCVGSMGKAAELLNNLLDMTDNTPEGGKQKTKEDIDNEKTYLVTSIASITEEMNKLKELYEPPTGAMH